MSLNHQNAILPGGQVHDDEHGLVRGEETATAQDTAQQQQTSESKETDPHREDEIERPRSLFSDVTSEDDDSEDATNALSSDGVGEGGIIGHDDHQELVRIATTLSRRQSIVVGLPPIGQTFSQSPEEYDSTLDPAHDDFNIRKWLKSFLYQMREQGIAQHATTGIAFRNLDVFGSGEALQLQATLWSVLSTPLRVAEWFSFGAKKNQRKQILHGFDGVVEPGELLIVLGRPGSGCTTLLKSLCGELHGLELGENSNIHYNGIPQEQMTKEFKGEAVYNQEVDKHFPYLTVGQTLEFAASVRTPSQRIHNISREEYCRYMAKVCMATFGLSHTYNTLVGNDFVRGVSGGERKRVSIAEMVLSGAPLSAWDNSTRGLDSATALKFVQSLRMAADVGGSTTAVAIYQASQDIYELFDKAAVLYEGRQIFYGPADGAKAYFERMGWYCPARQTTGDFLTSVTNPAERQAREGMENQVPRTPEDFERAWRGSPEYRALHTSIDRYEETHLGEHQGEGVTNLRQDKNLRQSKHVRPKSPYMISVLMQVRLCTRRAYQRIWNNRSATFSAAISQLIVALIVGSIFYGTPDGTVGFSSKGSVLFLAILFNALQAISEIAGLYAQRPIVEKHKSYAFYHPAAEAAAGIAADVPIKLVTSTVFNIVLYFLAGLRREPGQFFLYYLITFMSTFIMMAVFRTVAASTKTQASALTFAGLIVLALVIYTGFTVPQPSMKPWFSWIRWINPIYYAFEILLANEFHGREFTCSAIIPPYTPLQGDSWICNVKGAIAGRHTVSGDDYLRVNYHYSYSHVWRNFGILIGFFFFFTAVYLVAIELNSSTESTAEALVFKRGSVPAYLQQGSGKKRTGSGDEEMTGGEKVTLETSQQTDNVQKVLEPQKDIFTWRNVVYDIEIKGNPRRLLDEVSGYVKPGTLTALMGVSGAGKTTLLDALAQRTTTGVITGDMFVNGKPLGASFQRNTGYCQQQDLHLETSTVRESLRFSAMLRQPKSVTQAEKYDFVEEIIKMLNMEDFADAVVGVPGEGLNVEQRKLLTIGVELAAKPKLLLFLDEPTSGLDSQSSWAICSLLRKLADSGQAILCTIHQPSAILFQSFDRLLFLAKGGKTVYFGEIGENSKTLLDYFESNGAPHCDDAANPAEYMLDIVNKGRNDRGEDWHSVWKASPEAIKLQEELEAIHEEKKHVESSVADQPGSQDEFAMPFSVQLRVVTKRLFECYIRMPSYILAKFMLGIFAGLFIGFTVFQADSSQQGSSNVLFAVFLLTTIFTSIVQQIQPQFLKQRSLYEVRERPSKAYSWKAFMMASILVEIPFQIITGILIFACFYYPVVGVQSSYRQGIVLLFVIQLLIYAGAFAQMTIAAFPDAQTAAALVTLLSLLSTIFSGVLQGPKALPGFWIFMYRASPFTYWISGIVATVLHDRPVHCAADEVSRFDPPSNTTCGEYLAPLLAKTGTIQNPDATSQCRYCAFTVADQQLAPSDISWDDKWRNYGIFWAYIAFDMFMAVFVYWAFRVRKGKKKT